MKRLLFTLVLLAALLLPEKGDARMTTPGVVGAAVLSSMTESPSVRVVVLFDGDDLSLTDLGARSQAIAERREAVLDQISPGEFRVTDTFTNLSAVGGYVTYEGLKKLVRDYRVQKIDLDVPGHMALAESSELVRARDLIDAERGELRVAVLLGERGEHGKHQQDARHHGHEQLRLPLVLDEMSE